MSYSPPRGSATTYVVLRLGLLITFSGAGLGACGDDPRKAPDVPPVGNDLAIETPEDVEVRMQLSAAGDGMFSVEVTVAPEHGTTSEVDANGFVTFVPDADFHGVDSFVFVVTDREGRSGEGTVTITVTPVNDPPTITALGDQAIDVDESTGALGFVVGDVESDADGLTIVATSSAPETVPDDSVNLVLGGSGANRTIEVVPAENAVGSSTITLAVSDGVDTTTTEFTVVVTRPGRLYWMTAAGGMWRVDVDGENAIELRTGITGASVVAVDPVARAVFYARGSAIVRADENGDDPVDVVANGGFPSGLAVDATNRKLYWSDFNGSRVRRSELDGSSPAEVLSGVNSPSALSVDATNGKVYLLTYNNTRIVRFDLDGTNAQTIAMNLGGLGVGLAVDVSGGKLYFSTRGSSLYVARLDGSDVTELLTAQTSVHGLAIDPAGGRIYWADWLGQAIRRADLADGGNPTDVNSGLARNLGLAFMPAP